MYILRGWCILVGFGFLLLSCSGLEMPQFSPEKTQPTPDKTQPAPEKTQPGVAPSVSKDCPRAMSVGMTRVFLALIILFFALSGAVVRVFQSMMTTFALCGPLQMNSNRWTSVSPSFVISSLRQLP